MPQPENMVVVGRAAPDVMGRARDDDSDVNRRRAIAGRLEVAAEIEDVLLLAAERWEVILAEDSDFHTSPTRTNAKPRRFSS